MLKVMHNQIKGNQNVCKIISSVTNESYNARTGEYNLHGTSVKKGLIRRKNFGNMNSDNLALLLQLLFILPVCYSALLQL